MIPLVSFLYFVNVNGFEFCSQNNSEFDLLDMTRSNTTDVGYTGLLQEADIDQGIDG